MASDTDIPQGMYITGNMLLECSGLFYLYDTLRRFYIELGSND